MPRKRPKTAADRPTYRTTARPPLPKELEGFSDGLQLRAIVQRYGLSDVQRVLAILAEEERRELTERRCSETLDAWKSNTRPLAPIRIPRLPSIPPAAAQRSRHGKSAEEMLDAVIRQQTRKRELEDGLAVMHLENDWRRSQIVEIAERTIAGETAKEIAESMGVSDATIERRLKEVREAANSRSRTF